MAKRPPIIVLLSNHQLVHNYIPSSVYDTESPEGTVTTINLDL